MLSVRHFQTLLDWDFTKTNISVNSAALCFSVKDSMTDDLLFHTREFETVSSNKYISRINCDFLASIPMFFQRSNIQNQYYLNVIIMVLQQP